jgi:hypothetical protein
VLSLGLLEKRIRSAAIHRRRFSRGDEYAQKRAACKPVDKSSSEHPRQHRVIAFYRAAACVQLARGLPTAIEKQVRNSAVAL